MPQFVDFQPEARAIALCRTNAAFHFLIATLLPSFHCLSLPCITNHRNCDKTLLSTAIPCSHCVLYFYSFSIVFARCQQHLLIIHSLIHMINTIDHPATHSPVAPSAVSAARSRSSSKAAPHLEILTLKATARLSPFNHRHRSDATNRKQSSQWPTLTSYPNRSSRVVIAFATAATM
jgi:hypothetical protein